MQLNKSIILYILTFLGIFSDLTSVRGQEMNLAMDPAGYVNKYNKNFKGVGPQVYVLPSPRTREELLTDSYKDKLYFQDSIDSALDLQQLKEEFKPTNNTASVRYLLSSNPTTTAAWNTLIEKEIARGNYNGAYGLLHIYADQSLKQGNVQQALASLQSALQHAQKTPNTSDIATIQYNLANLYLFTKNIQQAGHFQETFYKNAIDQKSLIDQANSLIKIALIQAHDNDFRSAENNIIRKAIPLIKKSKVQERKIGAWLTLAKIYQLQNKHTEAQWFLIQARDLANAKKLNSELAEIEYMLASSKLVQKNYKVAKREFLQADELAKTEDNKLLQLAIVDKLGQIYMSQSDLNEAEDALNSYNSLRKQLFNE